MRLAVCVCLLVVSSPASANKLTGAVEAAKAIVKLAVPKAAPKAAVAVVHPTTPSAAPAKGAVADKSTSDKVADRLIKLKDVGEMGEKYDSACNQSSQRYDSRTCAPVKAVRNTINAPRKADRK